MFVDFYMRFSYFSFITSFTLITFVTSIVSAQKGAPALNVTKNKSQIFANNEVMHLFDFEERELHFNPIPIHWQKYVDHEVEGFPHFAYGELSKTHHLSGEYGFKLVSDGGSVGYQYSKGIIDAEPGNDFQITGYAYFENCVNSRVRIVCALTDRDDNIIEGSVQNSLDHSIDQTGPNGWTQINVYVPGNFPNARFITLSIWLLQEENWRKSSEKINNIYRKEVNAKVWFDDISILQLPRVILKTTKLSNVFRGDDHPTLTIQVDGVGSLHFTINVKVTDALGGTVFKDEWLLSGIEGTKIQARDIELPNLIFGYYNAELSIVSNDKQIATRNLNFIRLPNISGDVYSGQNFGINVSSRETGHWEIMTNLVDLSNARSIILPIWRELPSIPVAITTEPDFKNKLLKLQKTNTNIIAAFTEIPLTLTSTLDFGKKSVLDALEQPEKIWEKTISDLLATYAQQIPLWLIGDEIFNNHVWDNRIKPVTKVLTKKFSQILGETVIHLPIYNFLDINASDAGSTSAFILVNNRISPEDIPFYLQTFKDNGFNKLISYIKPINDKLYSREQRLIDFSKRLAFSVTLPRTSVFIDHPWKEVQYNARKKIIPSEYLLPFRTFNDLIGGTNYLGSFSMGPGVKALVYEYDSKGVIVTWDAHFSHINNKPKDLKLYLGDKPQIYDIFGNEKQIVNAQRKSIFTIDHWPKIITHINPDIAALRTSVAITPQIIEASIERQNVIFSFTNPFDYSITGRLRFKPTETQGNWDINPKVNNFVLLPKQAYKQRITLKFPRNELGGEKILHALLSIDANRSYDLSLQLPFEIKLKNIEVNYFVQKKNIDDLEIQMNITNLSKKSINLEAYVDLPDNERKFKLITQLHPDITVKKKFYIRDVGKRLGKRVRLGVYDPKGSKRINFELLID
jgi:hypothetical protein